MSVLGLSSQEAKTLLAKFGPNDLQKRNRFKALITFLNQFRSPLVYLLIFCGIVTFYLGDLVDTIMIGLAVTVNTVLGFFQEYKAEAAIEAIMAVLESNAQVKRNGVWTDVLVKEIVPGDLVRLTIGKKVPADGFLITGEVFLNEGILTGESKAVHKQVFEEEKGLFEDVPEVSRCYAGTVVESGIGEMVVINTGLNTRIGKISKIVEHLSEKTPLQLKVARLSSQIAAVILGMILILAVIGVWEGRGIVVMLPLSVSLVVAAVPEGLLIGFTMILTVGMKRILKKKAVVRSLAAAETLGGVQVICLDKTGTLTEGKMKAVAMIAAPGKLSTEYDSELDELLLAAVLCNDFRDPLEFAMSDIAKKIWKGSKRKALGVDYERVDDLPFDHRYKYLVTSHRKKGSSEMVDFMSGAPETVLGFAKMKEEIRSGWLKTFVEAGKEGYRIVGFAMRKSKKDKIEREGLRDLEWLGLVVFKDPVRREVIESLRQARLAGIELKVITGDYSETAWATMKEVGLVSEDETPKSQVLTGEELSKLSPEEREERVMKTVLFARTSPEQKLEIVEGLQRGNKIVAMMGDGFNDAPALKKADIGIVVSGASEVARESADLILLENNFDSILAAVVEGRLIFQNLQKLIIFLLSDSLGGVILMAWAVVMKWPLPILPVQILWVNLVSDGLPYLAFVFEPAGVDFSKTKPRDKEKEILNWPMWLLILVISFWISLILISSFWLYWSVLGYGLEEAQAIVFLIFAMCPLVYGFSLRSLHLPMGENKERNNWFWAGLLFGVASIFVMRLVLPVARIFGLVSLRAGDYIWVTVLVVLIMLLVELSKLIVIRENHNVVKLKG